MDVMKKKRGRPSLGKVDDLDKWRSYPNLRIPQDEKRFKRFAKKLSFYESNNQFRGGLFYCKLGKPINEARIVRYEAMCHKVVRQFFPALMLWEAGYVYEDLINMCRREVFLALLDGFDPVKAMTSTNPDPEKRAAIEQTKRANPEETYDKSEKSIVYGRLQGFVRRERWKHHPSQLGGYSISRESLLYDQVEGNIHSCNEYRYGMFTTPNQDYLLSPNLEKQKEKFLKILETEGESALVKCFSKLSESEKQYFVEYLKDSDHANWTGVANFVEDQCKSE